MVDDRLETGDGIKIEVKSAAYVQSWKQKRLSRLVFGIAPTLAWDPLTDEFDKEKRSNSDVYVFCVLAHKDQETIDPLQSGSVGILSRLFHRFGANGFM